MGWENVFQIEIDDFCNKVLEKHFPETLRFKDIFEFNERLRNGEIITDTSSETSRIESGEINYKGGRTDENRREGIRQAYGEACTDRIRTAGASNGTINIGHIDIITGGFPCQPFSQAGKRKGTDDNRYLWPEMLTTIRIIKPPFVVGENVAGLVSMENGKTLDRILSDLANEGYTTEQFIIPACSVGAWHRRDRIWIIGYRNVSNPNGKGSQRHGGLQERGGQWTAWRGSESLKGIWQSEPDVGGVVARFSSTLDGYWEREPKGILRVAIGVKNRVNRLKALGNAIVPQVAYEIFKAIEQIDKCKVLE